MGLKGFKKKFALCKIIQDSLFGFWIPYGGFQILGPYWILYHLSVELGFSIPIISRIPDFLSCFPDSQAQGSRVPYSTRKFFFYCIPKTGLPYLRQSTAYGFKSLWSPESFSGFLHQCINCVHNCKDHSSFDLTTAYCWSLSGDSVG